jgi:Fe-S cluster assembly protein SufD
MKPLIIKSGTTKTHLQLVDQTAHGEYIVQEDATVTVVVTAYGNHDCSGKVHVRLQGTRSVANIIGIFISSKTNQISLHTLQHHEARDTTSNLLVKTVLKDTSHFSYDGAIRVEYSGQKTDAYQRNENLMLSDTAVAKSKPSLEILANDVRCTHGATVGNVNTDQLFYMKSRGIDEKTGTTLIVEGFLQEAISKIPDEAIQQQVKEIVWQNL